jgi:hypothetical protein
MLAPKLHVCCCRCLLCHAVTNTVTGGGVTGAMATAAVNKKIDQTAATLTGQKSSAAPATGSLAVTTIAAAGCMLLLLL